MESVSDAELKNMWLIAFLRQILHCAISVLFNDLWLLSHDGKILSTCTPQSLKIMIFRSWWS